MKIKIQSKSVYTIVKWSEDKADLANAISHLSHDKSSNLSKNAIDRSVLYLFLSPRPTIYAIASRTECNSAADSRVPSRRLSRAIRTLEIFVRRPRTPLVALRFFFISSFFVFLLLGRAEPLHSLP